MTPEQIEIYRKAAELGTIPDSQNPLFLLQGTHTDLLVRILMRDFSVTDLARHELECRGLNEQGKWVGFDQKPKIQKPLKKAKRKGRGL
jgi:hypothetical protein